MNKLAVEFYKTHGRTASQVTKLAFAEKTLYADLKGSPEQQLEFLRKRGKDVITSGAWDSMSAEAHDKAFTVANVANANVVQKIYESIEKAKKDGTTMDQFKKELLPSIEQAGISAGRLTVVYQTNMQMAYSKGVHQAFASMTDKYPYWKYNQIQRATMDPLHSEFNGKIYRCDDPIWSWLYPPSRPGCGCYITPVEEVTDNLSNGKDYEDYKNENSKAFSMSPLKAWEPDTTKYVSGLKKELDAILKNKPKLNETDVNKHINVKKIKEHEEYIDNIIKDRQDLIELLSNNKDKITKWINDSSVAINIPTKNIFDILDSGYKTQFETKKSTGLYDPNSRLKIEKEMFNYAVDDKSRPIYAYLTGDDSSSTASQYGDVKLILRKNIVDNSTLTGVDSLFGYSPAYTKDNFNIYSMLNINKDMSGYDAAGQKSPIQQIEKNLKMINKANAIKDLDIDVAGAMGRYDYIEAQIHSKVVADDIVEIRYRRDEKELFNPLTKAEEIENYDLMVIKCKTSKKILIDDYTGKTIVGEKDWIDSNYEIAKADYYKKKKDILPKTDNNNKTTDIKRKINELNSNIDKHNAKIKDYEDGKTKDATKTAEFNFYIKKEASLRDLKSIEVGKLEKQLKDIENGTNS